LRTPLINPLGDALVFLGTLGPAPPEGLSSNGATGGDQHHRVPDPDRNIKFFGNSLPVMQV